MFVLFKGKYARPMFIFGKGAGLPLAMAPAPATKFYEVLGPSDASFSHCKFNANWIVVYLETVLPCLSSSRNNCFDSCQWPGILYRHVPSRKSSRSGSQLPVSGIQWRFFQICVRHSNLFSAVEFSESSNRVEDSENQATITLQTGSRTLAEWFPMSTLEILRLRQVPV
jgi:hypothetical protein